MDRLVKPAKKSPKLKRKITKNIKRLQMFWQGENTDDNTGKGPCRAWGMSQERY